MRRKVVFKRFLKDVEGFYSESIIQIPPPPL